MIARRFTAVLAVTRCNIVAICGVALAVGLLAVAPAILNAQPEAEDERAARTLKVGWAEADITPEGPVHLTGLGRVVRITDQVKDPLKATVLALESVAPDRPGRAVMVSLDLLSASECIRDAVREHLRQELPDLPPESVFFFATHAHTAPFHYTRPRYQPDFEQTEEPWIFRRHDDEAFRKAREAMPPLTCRQYVGFASRRIADAVKTAWTGRAGGGIAFGLGHAVVGRNRLTVDRNGEGRMYGRTNIPDFSHIQGYEDHSVNFLATYRPDGALSGLIVNIACPAQAETSGRQVSADFWHETRAELRRRFGDGLFILPQVSSAGDQDTNEPFEAAAARRMARLAGRTSRQEIAVRIADAANQVLPLIQSEIDWRPVVAHHVAILELPRLEPKPDNPNLPIEVHALRLGDVGIVTSPFELFLDYGIRIKARSPAVQTFVVQLAGPGSYLPSARAMESGGYGATTGSREVGPEGGDKLVEWSLDVLNAFWR
ncbi:MAG: hypothetical protein RBS80_21180 [Thermoguttaceae bacterium]|jgi:hypothetical protein|nr:hypothetical protein [Thermoguttaceae bacterium]